MRQNLREMRGRVLNLLGPEAEAVVQPAEVDYQINLSDKKVIKEKDLYQTSYTTSSVADTRIYTPPRRLTKLSGVDFDENELSRVNLQNIIDLGENLSIEAPLWTEDV